ncbi:RHS repeat domain-containing protein, partial [Candidatus Fervidibacter sacchari]
NQTTQFEYDFDNRLVKITYPNGKEVRFGYDGLGRRVFRQEGASVRYFYYDGDKIIAEREGNSWVVRYLLGLRYCGHVVSGQIRVYHADRLGSIRWITDGSGSLGASFVYEGFGKIVGQDGNETVPYQFCGLWGYRDDGDAGLLHVGARYYEVETGRWLQKDKIIIERQNDNKYTYCSNNPINCVDPNGLVWDYIERIWDWYEKSKFVEDVSDLLVSWYIVYIDFITHIKLREQLRDWKPLRDDIDYSRFSPIFESSIKDSLKNISEVIVETNEFIWTNIR